MEKNNVRVILFAVSASILWGLSFPVIVLGLEDIQPLLFGAVRFVIVTIFLVALTLIFTGRTVFQRTARDWYKITALGITSITAPIILQNIGMLSTTAHISSILQSTGPVFVLFLAFFFLGEPLTRKKSGGIILASLGTYLVIMGDTPFTADTSLQGNLLVLLSAFSYSLASIIAKSCLQDGIKPLSLLTLSAIPGTFFLLVLTPFFETLTVTFSTNGWITILFLALGPSLLATILWYDAMTRQEISRLSFFIYLIPLFAIIFSYFLLEEIVTFITIISAGFIITGVALAQS